MDSNLQCLDMNTLKALYEKETDELNAALLNGMEWSDLKDRRKMITDIASMLQSKRMGEPRNNNPAETSSRKSV